MYVYGRCLIKKGEKAIEKESSSLLFCVTHFIVTGV